MKIISKKSVILSSITSLVFLMSISTQAKIYKWTDANGQTHYTAQPPKQTKKGTKATNIEDKIKAHAGKYRAPSSTQKTVAKDPAKTDQEDENIELSGPDKKLVKYCKGQRSNLALLKKNFRNIWIDAKGKKTKLNQEQRKEKVAMLQNQIQEECSDIKPEKTI